jgi:hypothetical protein
MYWSPSRGEEWRTMNDPRARRAVAGALLAAALLAACGQPAAEVPVPAMPTASTAQLPTTAAQPAGTPAPAAFAHQPLWPFADATQVRAWQDAYRAGGQQPWHLDPGETALSFTQGYLGFAGIDRVVATTRGGNDAWVEVGFALPDGRLSTAAAVHLARWGTGADAPWEVAGTRDTTLVLDLPSYGSTVRTPLTVGGAVTGVDESLRVRVIGPTGQVGESCCLPAGGDARRWTTTVPLTGTARGTLTVVVSTGGHVTDVERFAVTGVTG